MHTAFSLKGSMFEIEMNGQVVNREALLDWQPNDRLGIVLNSPLGALGASMLMQLVTTAYYDVRPSRRQAPHYAEIYLFHLGGRYGDFSSFDVLPRREVFLPADPEALLEAINDRGITHLAVPDGTVQHLNFLWNEPEAARDRIRRCFAYTSHGCTSDADIVIMSHDLDVRNDVELALDPIALAENIERYIGASDVNVQLYSRKLAERVRSRLGEISADEKMTARKNHGTIPENCTMRQTFRKVTVDHALGML